MVEIGSVAAEIFLIWTNVARTNAVWTTVAWTNVTAIVEVTSRLFHEPTFKVSSKSGQ